MKWGLIGASDIAATRVAPAMREAGDEVYGVLSSSEERAESYSRAAGIEHATTSLDELLSWPVDAVYISTTNDLHAAQAIAAANSGKHILCEKPLATNLADAREMVACAARNDVVLATNHHIRVSGVHVKMRDIVLSGQIGDVVVARINHAVSLPERLRGWRLSGVDKGAGVVLDITVHNVDTLRAALGSDIVEVTALTSNSGLAQGDVADSSSCLFRFANGALATTVESFLVPFGTTSFEIHGTEGSLFGVGVMSQDPTGTLTLSDAQGQREVDVMDRENMYVKTVRQFTLACRREASPYATAHDGLASLTGALGVLMSAQQKRTVSMSEFENE